MLIDLYCIFNMDCFGVFCLEYFEDNCISLAGNVIVYVNGVEQIVTYSISFYHIPDPPSMVEF